MSVFDVMNINDVSWRYLHPDALNADKNPAVVTVGGEEFVVEIDYARWESYDVAMNTRRQVAGFIIPMAEGDLEMRQHQEELRGSFTAYVCTLPAVPRSTWEAVQDRRSIQQRNLV